MLSILLFTYKSKVIRSYVDAGRDYKRDSMHSKKVKKHVSLTLIVTVILLTTSYIFTVAHAVGRPAPKILYIGPSFSGFITSLAIYGDLNQLSVTEANRLTIDDLKQYDIIATVDDSNWISSAELASRIGKLVSEYGKSFIALTPTLYSSTGFPNNPATAWVSVKQLDSCNVRLVVVNTSLTQNIGDFRCQGGVHLLYGRYPLIYIPDDTAIRYNIPKQGAIVVYGYYGKGKYVIISSSFFGGTIVGDKGKLFSNIMYWLTGEEIPQPPEFREYLSNLNEEIKSLYRDVANIKSEVGNVTSVMNQIASLEQKISLLGQKVDALEKRLEESKSSGIASYWILGLSLLSIVLALMVLVLALRKHSH